MVRKFLIVSVVLFSIFLSVPVWAMEGGLQNKNDSSIFMASGEARGTSNNVRSLTPMDLAGLRQLMLFPASEKKPTAADMGNTSGTRSVDTNPIADLHLKALTVYGLYLAPNNELLIAVYEDGDAYRRTATFRSPYQNLSVHSMQTGYSGGSVRARMVFYSTGLYYSGYPSNISGQSFFVEAICYYTGRVLTASHFF